MTERDSVDASVGAVSADPWWIRILEFPLVALLLATALTLTSYVGAFFILSYNPPMEPAVKAMSQAVWVIALMWVVYKLVTRHLGEKPHDDLPIGGAVRGSVEGVVLGTLLMGAIVAVAALTGAYRYVGLGDTSQLITSIFLLALLPGFWEELLFRGVFFRWFEEFGGSWFALALTSAFFGLAHSFNPNATWWSSLAIGMEAGLLLGGAYMATRSLWVPIGLHASWNFVQGQVFGVPVSGIAVSGLIEQESGGPDWLSGGAFGLEASVIALAAATIVSLWLLRIAHRRGLIFGPMWSRPGALELPDQPLYLTAEPAQRKL